MLMLGFFFKKKTLDKDLEQLRAKFEKRINQKQKKSSKSESYLNETLERLGFKAESQHYIKEILTDVDCYLPNENLIIQYDGLNHYKGKHRTLKTNFQTMLLEQSGYKVLRINSKRWRKHDKDRDVWLKKRIDEKLN
jgi:very-short-patch-repair endonuclease